METKSPSLPGNRAEMKTREKAAEVPKAKPDLKTENGIFQNPAVLTGIPVLAIALAELLIYAGAAGAAIWIHIGILVALSLSTIVIRNQEINRIHQALMLLPILRLVNLSMPIFFDITLYSFIFIYGTLAIPVTITAMNQKLGWEQMGLTSEKMWLYMLLATPLGFLLGYGEYSTIHTGYLVPDLSFANLLKLTLVMVFFVGLIEELIFRSILQTRLEQVFGMKLGLIGASVLFGLMHSGYGTPYEMFYTCFVGLFMGYTFQRTRSLPFITVLHGFVNVFLFGIIPHVLPGTGLF